MEVTKFVVEGRDEAKLNGDYSAYRVRLSNRIHNLRKKLGIATKPRAKYTNRPVTAEDISQNHEYVNLLLLTPERAWAHAMSMKEIHSADTKGITGSTRSHIISRLHKSTIYANDLFRLLSDKAITNANDVDILEARAYAASLAGAMEFEKQSWEACVKSYSEARIIYTALSKDTKTDIFKDLLTDPVDPSIRYGAYKMGMPRTLAISVIARKNFPSDPKLVSQVQELDSDCLKDETTKTKVDHAESGDTPKTITWRSRTVDLEDAAIATALGSVKSASLKLSEVLSSGTLKTHTERGSAYDDIMSASQDAVDATKHAIDGLVSEHVGQSDKRMQSLLVTRTAVSYDMIGWRIGRNRLMAGDQDGIVLIQHRQFFRRQGKKLIPLVHGPKRKLEDLKVVLKHHENIMQDVELAKNLPGVAADSTLLEELDAKYSYFQALKCLTIARSHAILSNPKNALALLNRATEKCSSAHSYLSSLMDTTTTASPPNLTVTPSESQTLLNYLQCELQRYRALVEISNLTAAAAEREYSIDPLLYHLDRYPASGVVDLNHIVDLPPKLEVVPVKPLFFDAAWNYIDYPGRTVEKAVGKNVVKEDTKDAQLEASQQQQKKGWFGFGR